MQWKRSGTNESFSVFRLVRLPSPRRRAPKFDGCFGALKARCFHATPPRARARASSVDRACGAWAPVRRCAPFEEGVVQTFRLMFGALVLVGSGTLLAGGCKKHSSSSSSSFSSAPCASAPSTCGSHESCWLSQQGELVCMAPGAGKLGSGCTATPGVAACAPGLFCLAPASSPDHGVCMAFCGQSNDCPAPTQCRSIAAGSTPVQVCTMPATDAGSDSGESGADGNVGSDAAALDAGSG